MNPSDLTFRFTDADAAGRFLRLLVAMQDAGPDQIAIWAEGLPDGASRCAWYDAPAYRIAFESERRVDLDTAWNTCYLPGQFDSLDAMTEHLRALEALMDAVKWNGPEFDHYNAISGELYSWGAEWSEDLKQEALMDSYEVEQAEREAGYPNREFEHDTPDMSEVSREDETIDDTEYMDTEERIEHDEREYGMGSNANDRSDWQGGDY